MKKIKSGVSAAVLISTVLLLSGCSTVSSAYDSTVSTVSGWFGKGDNKAD